MTAFLDCWKSVAASLFSQALAGEPSLEEGEVGADPPATFAFVATLEGQCQGTFTVLIESSVFDIPLMGDGVDQKAGWAEILREVAEAAAGELLARTGMRARVSACNATETPGAVTHAFQLKSSIGSWSILVADTTLFREPELALDESSSRAPTPAPQHGESSDRPGIALLLDVELEASLRFGCRELPLSEVLDLGPGDVVELDRQVTDPVDLIVGDKIVARGEVVLVNGNFGLRVTEVAEPRKRLESIRCLF